MVSEILGDAEESRGSCPEWVTVLARETRHGGPADGGNEEGIYQS